MNAVKKYLKFLFITVFIQPIIIFLIPLTNISGSLFEKVIAYAFASFFWLSLIIEIILLVNFNYSCKKITERIQKNQNRKTVKKNFRLPGIFCFCKNKEAVSADVLMFFSAIVLVIMIIAHLKIGWLIALSVSILFMSFNLHCILNGKNYRLAKRFLQKKEGERNDKIKS